MDMWRTITFFSVGLLLLSGCSSSNTRGTYVIPDNMPEICRSVDFDEDPEMMKPCGVKSKMFRSKSTGDPPSDSTEWCILGALQRRSGVAPSQL